MESAHRFTLRLEPGAPLVYDRRAHQYFELSAPEARLLDEAQRLPLPGAMERLVRRHGQQAADQARADLTVLGAPAEVFGATVRALRLSPIPGARGAPLIAHLGLTCACNFTT
ncbi:MAG TPA: hypothetical protein VGK67_06330 [Myxococcales bacterium]|jgi:hypothetical protein